MCLKSGGWGRGSVVAKDAGWGTFFGVVTGLDRFRLKSFGPLAQLVRAADS